MQTPVGPSARLMLGVVELATEVTEQALLTVWERWLGPQRFQRKLEQLQRAGLVEPSAEPGSVDRIIRLTDAGRMAGAGGRDLNACWARPWDGTWRVALFDVQESKRSMRIRLQRQLRRLHFGYLQDSVWVSPDPMGKLRSHLEAAPVDAATLTFLDARPGSGETDADIVHGSWNFGRINRDYENYLKVLGSLGVAAGEKARRNWLQVEWQAWCHAVRGDPLLPAVLLPRGYRGRDAWARREQRMRQVLHPERFA